MISLVVYGQVQRVLGACVRVWSTGQGDTGWTRGVVYSQSLIHTLKQAKKCCFSHGYMPAHWLEEQEKRIQKTWLKKVRRKCKMHQGDKIYKRQDERKRFFQPWPQKNPQHWRCEIPTGFSVQSQRHVWSGCVRAACHQLALWATPTQITGRRGEEQE